MTNRNIRSPLACTAIAAVLAAVSNPAFAQDTATTGPAPAPAPAAEAPAPAAAAPIVLPEFKTQPAAEPSAAAPEPVAAAPVAATTATRAAPRSTARGAAAPAAAAPVAAQAAAPSAAVEPATDTSPTTPLASPEPIASAQPSAAPASAPSNDNTAEIALGLLGLAAVGGLGAFAVSRRRRRVVNEDRRLEAEPVATVAPPVAAPIQAAWAPTATTATAVPTPFMFERKVEAAPVDSPSRRVRSADMIPAGPLPTGAALAALLERMVAASPDKDNPFKSEKRRRARVRWLLKQHEYRLADPEGMTEADRYAAKQDGFDFRTYKSSIKAPVDERAGKEVVPA